MRLGYPIGAIVFGGTMGDLSKHFSKSEFACPCCGYGYEDGEVSPELVRRLELLRETLRKYGGGSVLINSGCRCSKHNRKVGGVSNSQHLRGTAADIRVVGVAPDRVADTAERIFADGGLGRYNTFTHVDVRGHRARWDMRSTKDE